ncbi:MAG: TlpA family protein disulfide reductase [Candidatus Didemnitutus sp.]|nr:TlpA family protein disulfide reductase [Candidatus Didemnitutus sp.]
MRSRLVSLVLSASVLLLAGCGKPSADAGAPTAASVAAAPSTLPTLGPVPDFRLTTLDGAEVSAAALKGKVVVVDFWATWCGPCIAEIPGYIEMQKQYGPQGLVIVGVSLDRKGAEHVKEFAAKRGINYALAMGDEALVEAFGGIEAIPTTFLIDREGKVRHRKVGGMDHAAYEALVKPLL